MKTTDLKIQFNKSGSGSLTPRVTLPASWIEELNITPEDREVIVTLLDDSIVIRKSIQNAGTLENAIDERVKNISFNKSGNKSKSTTTRIIIPMIYVKHLDLDPENRDALVTFENNMITIEKQK